LTSGDGRNVTLVQAWLDPPVLTKKAA
jgi:hypothetical protein